MKKIPSLFKRDYEGTRQVYDEVVPGSEWVTAGEGVATEKYDGTACLVRGEKLYKRYDRKKNKKTGEYKPAPEGWEAAQEADPVTGHWPGWLPVGDGPEDKYHREAAERMVGDGTYELIGPKVQGNPYDWPTHQLFAHDDVFEDQPPRDFEGLREWLMDNPDVEGIVWHHPDGRMVKIKQKDFGFDWPSKSSS